MKQGSIPFLLVLILQNQASPFSLGDNASSFYQSSKTSAKWAVNLYLQVTICLPSAYASESSWLATAL